MTQLKERRETAINGLFVLIESELNEADKLMNLELERAVCCGRYPNYIKYIKSCLSNARFFLNYLQKYFPESLGRALNLHSRYSNMTMACPLSA
ncbi:hypothetical protein FJZ19_03605 [Candidatus Pacearchaeota archaeon]|nr:hypothetical protein [Candidatus Pacearchaeota archaeon]